MSSLAIVALLGGCGGSVDMGAAPSDASLGDTASDVPAATSSAVTGKWVGYLESYKLPSGSDAVSLELTELTDGTAIGTVVFGTKPAPPPPTDPNTRYPPDLVAVPPHSTEVFAGEGFRYTVVSGTVAGKRLTLSINVRELWKPWCELQKSYNGGPSAPGAWACLPNWGFTCCDPGPCSQPDPSTGMSVARDCGQLYLCLLRQACTCTMTGCTSGTSTLTFDITMTADDMNGSMTGVLGNRNVHFTRAK